MEASHRACRHWQLLDASPTPTSRERQDSIYQWDLTFLRRYLVAKGVACECHVNPVIRELRRYFVLCILTNRSVPMVDPVVDMAWHCFILHTREYARFCTTAVGRFVHHDPVLKDDVAEHDYWREIEWFKAAYLSSFGTEYDPVETCRDTVGQLNPRSVLSYDCNEGGEPPPPPY